ncbi:MAG: hypothetical protein ABID61_03980 [Candidatus Micrarchaeota archaeon]
MAGVFKRDLKPTEKPPEERVVIRRAEVEIHSSLDALSRAAQVRPQDASTSVAQADRDLYALRNRQNHVDPIQLGKNFQALVEKMNV